jgi:CHAT domain-containing protein
MMTALEAGQTAVWITVQNDGCMLVAAGKDSEGVIYSEAVIHPEFSDDDLSQLIFGSTDKFRQAYEDGKSDALSIDDFGWTALSLESMAPEYWDNIIEHTIDTLGMRVWSAILDLVHPDTRELVLIPSAGFNVLPLHAVQLPDGRYVDELFDICYSPSLRTLSEARASVKCSGKSQILGQITNPTEDPGLGFTIAEAEQIAGLYDSNSVHMLPGRRAKVEKALELLKNCDVFHFAGHGFYDPDNPDGSGLICAVQKGHPTVLTLRAALAELGSIKSRLVVLSGCETGRVQSTDRLNDFLGLPGGLMTAGACAVIASLWQVDDLATAMLLTKFFETWKTGEVTIPQALKGAQSWLRSELTVAVAIEILEAWAKDPAVDSNIITQRRSELLSRPDKDALAYPQIRCWAAFYTTGLNDI